MGEGNAQLRKLNGLMYLVPDADVEPNVTQMPA